MRFAKYEGAGNDFILLDLRNGGATPQSAEIARLCDRHFGIGADGLMTLAASAVSGCDCSMRYYNADGSPGEMCGNGARCIARYGYENGLSGETQRIETTAGLVTGQRVTKRLYKVRLNDPSVIDLHRSVSVGGTAYNCAYIELGDPGIPHAIVLMPDWDERDHDMLRALGRALRFAKEFPRGANVSFVKVVDVGHVKAITYERGVEDFTLACGTGCGSTACVLWKKGLLPGKRLTAQVPGGTLKLTIEGETEVEKLLLEGPTEVAEILDI